MKVLSLVLYLIFSPGFAQTQSLSDNALANASYPFNNELPFGTVTLEDGFIENNAERYYVLLQDAPRLSADFNADGLLDAAVILEVNTGGSGIFSYLSVVLNQDGEAQALPAVLLGDRSPVELLLYDAETNGVTVFMTTQGAGEPFCCGTKKVKRLYTVTDSLELVDEQLIAAPYAQSTGDPFFPASGSRGLDVRAGFSAALDCANFYHADFHTY